MNTLALLRDRFASALSSLVDDASTVGRLSEMVLPSQDTKFGDYQANCAMPLGKQLGKSPRDVAADLVAALEVSDVCEAPNIAGPGFINLKLRDDWLVEQLTVASRDEARLGIAVADSPRTVVLDYSSPNVAKPMHVGHIRSTVIGAALYRVLGFLGHNVISDNHIGDWGTQFGMIIYGYKNLVDEKLLAEAPVTELGRLYKLVNQIADYQGTVADKLPALHEKIADQQNRVEDLQVIPPDLDAKAEKKAAKELRKAEGSLVELEKELHAAQAKVTAFEADAELKALADAHPGIGARALAETAKLHSGDAENRALWEKYLPACLEEIERTYRRLNVTFDHTLGESFYQPMLAGIVADLEQHGLAKESNGAMCVFLEGHKAPFIVRKQDGAFLYATTDLATIAYRLKEWQPDAILYVVDHRQSLHFEQLFATAKLSGATNVEMAHVSFGTVLGEDNKPYKTRSGSSVGLMGLLDEAVERARVIADGSSVLETDAERAEVAERIGIGAIKYADLSHNRESDYVFSYDKMLAMNGNTAAYMQYSCARVRSIFSRGGIEAATVRNSDAKIELTQLAERALGIALLGFAEALTRVASDYRPNHLTNYLFALASRYSEFFEHCPVLKAENEELKQSRLLLCDLTARTLERGLYLLGIEVVERM